jgi:hypothetical protein
MASSVSINRLHTASNVSATVDAKPAPVKTDIMSNSQPDLLAIQTAAWQQPARRRFGSPRGALTAPAIQSTVHPATAVDRAGAFADLAARDRFRALVAKHVERGAEPQPWPMAIQI